MKVKVKWEDAADLTNKICEMAGSGKSCEFFLLEGEPVEEGKECYKRLHDLELLFNREMGSFYKNVGKALDQEFDNIYRLIREMKG